MSSIKRLWLCVKNQIDNTSMQFENHEALATAAIEDLQKIGARSQVQLRYVQKSCQDLQNKLDVLDKEAEQWAKRAIQVRETNAQRALECVKRMKSCQNQIEQNTKQLLQYGIVEDRIQADIDAIQKKLQELQKKKQMLKARHNHTDMLSAMQQGQSSEQLPDSSEEVFERWEDSVIEKEFKYLQITEDPDPLATEFDRQEQDAELQSILDALVNQAQSATDKKGDSS